MPRNIITLQSLGKDATWLILRQARGMPDAKAIDDFLLEKTFIVSFAKPDVTERLCVTAAVSQMSGQIVHLAEGEGWNQAMNRNPELILGAINYYLDGVFIHGLPVAHWDPTLKTKFPIINCGSPDAHPAHAIADIACMLRFSNNDLRGKKVCWMGGPNGPLYSLMAATLFFPFSLVVCAPETNKKPDAVSYGQSMGTDITFVDTPKEAIKGAHFVMGGSMEGMSFNLQREWEINPHLMSFASPNAQFLLGTNPFDAIPVDNSIFKTRATTLFMQSEFRLRVYKRMLHWVFEV